MFLQRFNLKKERKTMKSRCLVSLLAGICLVFGIGRSAWAASAVTLPDEFPNGATETPDKSIHTRLEITLTGAIAIGNVHGH